MHGKVIKAPQQNQSSIAKWLKRHIYWLPWNFSIRKSFESPRPNFFFSDIITLSTNPGLLKRKEPTLIFVTWPMDRFSRSVFDSLASVLSRCRWNLLIYKMEKHPIINMYFFKFQHSRKITIKQKKMKHCRQK